jgi:hypothetical protein
VLNQTQSMSQMASSESGLVVFLMLK